MGGVGESEVVAAVAVLCSLTNEQLGEVYVQGVGHAELLAGSGSKQEAASWLLSVLKRQANGAQPVAVAAAGVGG